MNTQAGLEASAAGLARIEAVVIGASAGGVEGLRSLLPALPGSTRTAVFVVLHLPREYRSVLCEVFAPLCEIRLKEAEDKEPVRRGTAYFAPPDYHMLLDRGPDARAQIALSVDEPVHFSRPSIDVLFESAADLYGPRVLGMILTGASEDGAAGLAALKAAGGIAAVQQPGATYESQMANAALRRTPVDFVRPLTALAELLRELK